MNPASADRPQRQATSGVDYFGALLLDAGRNDFFPRLKAEECYRVDIRVPGRFRKRGEVDSRRLALL